MNINIVLQLITLFANLAVTVLLCALLFQMEFHQIMGWKVPRRDVWCDTFRGWMFHTIRIHVWLRIFRPRASKLTLGLCAILCIPAPLFVTGCSSTTSAGTTATNAPSASLDLNTATYDAELVAGTGMAGTVHTINVLTETNASASLLATKAQIYKIDTNVFEGLTILDEMRTNYVASGGTNAALAAAIQAQLSAVQSQTLTATNLVNSVQ